MAMVENSSRPQKHRIEQFLHLMRWIQLTTLGIMALELLAGGLTGTGQLFTLALVALWLLLSATLAHWIATSGKMRLAIITFNAGILVVLGILPLRFSGLLPMILVGYLITILLVGLFLSNSRILNQTVVATGLATIPIALEIWHPFETVEVGFLGLPFTLGALGVAGFMIHLFGRNLHDALEASEHNAGEIERSRAELLARSQELEQATIELEAHNQAMEALAHQSERRADLLQAGTRVTHSIAQITDMDELFKQVTRLISEHFGYYHAGIFLIDESGLYAELRAANSPGGQRMLSRGHKLGVGTTGIVGFVTGTGEPRIALDVGADTTFFNNPDLPNTRSEMAVPLLIGRRTIGALDIQSEQSGAFGNEDMTVMNALADHIAIAIENTKLMEQTQLALARAEATQKRFILQEWDSYLDGKRTRS